MANTLKILGQVNTTNTAATSLYTVPSGASAVISTLTICNLNSANNYYRIALRPNGATLANSHYIAYDNIVAPFDTVALSLGLTMGQNDVITVQGTFDSITFSAFGTEVT
jgi:hypothetical protein